MANCLLCKADYTGCVRCNTTTGWYLDTALTQCRHSTLAPLIADGFGANLITGQIAACQVANCLLCKADYTGCVGCDTVSSWYLKIGTQTCYHATNAPVFLIGEGPCIPDGSIAPCTDTNCKICTANYQTCTECDSTSNFKLKGNKCELRSSSINRDKDVENTSYALSQILAIMTFIARLVLAPFSYGAAFITQSLTSQLLILATLDGAEVSRSESVLRSVAHLARWFPTGNPFGNWGQRASCQLSPAMQRNQFACSLAGNMGANIVMLLVIGLVCTLITVAAMVVMVKASPSSTKIRAVMSWLRSNFGISFILSLGNALHFELLFYSLHTFTKISNSSVMIFSDFISAIIFVSLKLTMAIQIYLAIWIWKQISKTNRVVPEQPGVQQSKTSIKKSDELLRDTVDLNSVPRWISPFTYLFSEHRMPIRFFQLLIGSSLSLKNTIQAIVILSASDKPALQVSLVLVAELAHLCLYAVSRPTGTNLLFGVHVLNHICIVIFMILKLATLSAKVDIREGPLGKAMAAFVYIAILATSLYSLFAGVQAIIKLTHWIRAKKSLEYDREGLNDMPSSPTERVSLTKDAAKQSPAKLIQPVMKGDPQKVDLKDCSNLQGIKGRSAESPDHFRQTKMVDTRETLEHLKPAEQEPITTQPEYK